MPLRKASTNKGGFIARKVIPFDVRDEYVRVSRDREHGFHCIVSKYFAGS
jgi:hypothetical protein